MEQLISVIFFIDKISEYHSSIIDIGSGPSLQTGGEEEGTFSVVLSHVLVTIDRVWIGEWIY
jgi:hypothetical protein